MTFSFDIDDGTLDSKPSFVKKHPVLFPILIFAALVLGYYLLSGVGSSRIGVVKVEGVIVESAEIIRKIQILDKDPRVRGVIVRINSPGGAAAPAQEIFSELIRLGKKKKVYASISSLAASGGYYVAIGAEKIFANPSSLVGSIGTIMRTLNLEKMMDKLGVSMEVIASGKHKDMGSVFNPMGKEERNLIEAVLRDAHRQFIVDIADNRPLTLKETEKLADGRVFTGKQAFEFKLIDGLAGLSRVAEKMRLDLGLKDKIELFYPPEKEVPWESLLDLESLWSIKKELFHTGIFYLGQQELLYKN